MRETVIESRFECIPKIPTIYARYKFSRSISLLTIKKLRIPYLFHVIFICFAESLSVGIIKHITTTLHFALISSILYVRFLVSKCFSHIAVFTIDTICGKTVSEVLIKVRGNTFYSWITDARG